MRTAIKNAKPLAGDQGRRGQMRRDNSTTANTAIIPQTPSRDNLPLYKIETWHPLLGVEVYVWYQGRIETRVCTWVSQNERWLRLDGELLPVGCLVSNHEYSEIQKAVKELGYG